MAKLRVSIPESVAAQVLFASDHTCCKCEERGAPVQIHHIDDDPSNNDVSNLAVLCLACHHETQITGGFARQLTPAVVRLYRDAWIVRVEKRRSSADALFVARAVPANTMESKRRSVLGTKHDRMPTDEMELYIRMLPDIVRDAYANVADHWDGNTQSMLRAAYDVSEVLRKIWLRLAYIFPEGHFNGQSPDEYIANYIDSRYSWHRSMAEPFGVGTGGTIAGVLVARGVLRDLDMAVIDTRDSLKGLGESAHEREIWVERWNAARRILPRADPSQATDKDGRNFEPRTDMQQAENRTRMEALATEPILFDYVLSGSIVRVLATQLLNTTCGLTTYALSVQTRDGSDVIFDKIEGHHLTMFEEDMDGDGVPEIVVQYHCGAHTLALNVYRLKSARGIPRLVPGATIGSDWPEIRWDRRADGKGFMIMTKHRNWSGSPTQEFVIEQYAFEQGKCVKLPPKDGA